MDEGWKEDTNEYRGKYYTDECLNQYGRVSKEDTAEYQTKYYPDECLN